MRILNCSKTSRLISLRTSDVVIKPFSLSQNFNCTEKVFTKLIETPGYQNVMRFVMDPSERQILDICPVIQGTVITNAEAVDLELKFKSGYRIPEMDINGNIIKPAVEIAPAPEVKNEKDPEPQPEVETQEPENPEVDEEVAEVQEQPAKPFIKFEHHKDEAKLSQAKSYKRMKLIKENVEDHTIEYISNNPDIASIEDGKVILHKKGRTNIIATLKNKDGIDVMTDTYILTVR